MFVKLFTGKATPVLLTYIFPLGAPSLATLVEIGGARKAGAGIM